MNAINIGTVVKPHGSNDRTMLGIVKSIHINHDKSALCPADLYYEVAWTGGIKHFHDETEITTA